MRSIHLVGGISDRELKKALKFAATYESPIIIATLDGTTTITHVSISYDDPTGVDEELERIIRWMYDTV